LEEIDLRGSNLDESDYHSRTWAVRGDDLRPLAAFRFADASASLLGWREAPIDERFLQIQIALVVKCLSEDFERVPIAR
jgi:hypothetical protein